MSKIRDLKEQIKDLRKEAEFQTRKHLLEIDNTKNIVEQMFRQERREMHLRAERAETKAEEMEKRWNSSIQQQQEAIIKALIVKLPQVDIKEIHSHCEKK